MQPIRQADFTLFAHVFYPDVWKEMVVELEESIQHPFDLVITRPAGSQPAVWPRTCYLCTCTELVVENRGRDILPFLKALRRHDMSRDGIGLKLHTKRSPHRSDGDAWRQFLSGSLLKVDCDGKLLGHVLLASEPRIGLAAPPAHLLRLDGRTSINADVMERALQRIEPSASLTDLEGCRFPAGSMFWFRRCALQKVICSDLFDLFECEGGQLDGTAAHALERLFGIIVERQGFLAVGMENAGSILAHQGPPLSREELLLLIDQTLSDDNPFALPLADLWRRHPALLRYAHAIYARLPKAVVRSLRRSINR